MQKTMYPGSERTVRPDLSKYFDKQNNCYVLKYCYVLYSYCRIYYTRVKQKFIYFFQNIYEIPPRKYYNFSPSHNKWE